MKSLATHYLLPIILLVNALLVTSCSNLEDLAPPPTVILVTESNFSNVQFEPGDFVKVIIQAEVPGGLKDIFYNKTIENDEVSSTKVIGFTRGDVMFSDFIEIPVNEPVGTVVTVQLNIVDNNDQIASANTTYLVVAAGQGGGGSVPVLQEKVTVSLGVAGGANGSYLASSTGRVYTAAEAFNNQSIIDITFGVNNQNIPQLVSPDERANQGLATGNPVITTPRTTFFKPEPNGPTDLGTVSAIEIAQNITQGDLKHIAIEEGKTYSFVQGDAGNKKGYIYVKSLTGTGTQLIATIDVIVQQ